MKYIFDADSNNAFAQIFGVTESRKPGESPLAFQIRGSITVFERTLKVIEKVIERIADIEEHYHDEADHTAKQEFDYGFVVFEPGDLPIVAMVQRRDVYLSISGRQVGAYPIALEAFHRDLTNYLKKPRK